MTKIRRRIEGFMSADGEGESARETAVILQAVGVGC